MDILDMEKITCYFTAKMIRKWFKIQTRQIMPIQFILEGYEGMATVSTIDSRVAILQVLIMPDFIQEMEDILGSLQNEYRMQEIPSGSDQVF